MNIFRVIKLLVSNLQYLILIPLATGILVWFLTRNLSVHYSSEAAIFTGITSNTGIDDMENSKVDFFATQNAYNNVISILNSKSVLQETSIRLLTSHLMLDKPDKMIISPKSFAELHKILPDEVKRLIVKNDFEQSCNNIRKYIKQDNNNFVYGLLNYNHPHYSIKALSQINTLRIGTSDMIKISYTSDDPGICYNSIKILTEVFIDKYNALKVKQTGNAVEYFEAKFNNAFTKLNESEDKLLKFNTQNDIINYYEQTKHVSSQEEQIDLKLQEVKMEFEAAAAVLLRLEAEIEKRYDINLRNKEILEIREQLIKVNEALVKAELGNNENSRPPSYNLLKGKKNLEDQLENKIDSFYHIDDKTQGIEMQKMLGDWLDAVKKYEGNRALLKSMIERKGDFMKLYKQYAPLGSTLKRLEREIDINEKEYLELLHHLGLAKLKQQGADMSSNMSVLDQPKMPINPIPSKRKLYISIAIIFSFLFLLIRLFVIELLDQRPKTPERLKKMTDTEVIGAYCMDFKNVDTKLLNGRASVSVYEKINLTEQPDHTFVSIQLFSLYTDSGKEIVADYIKNQILKNGCSCKVYNFTNASPANETNQDYENFLHCRDYSCFYEKENKPSEYIIMILPPVSEGVLNPRLVAAGDFNILVSDAGQNWSDANNNLLVKLKGILKNQLFSVLSNTLPDNLEGLYGPVPRKYSFPERLFRNKILSIFSK